MSHKLLNLNTNHHAPAIDLSEWAGINRKRHMQTYLDHVSIITRLRIRPNAEAAFAEWQGKLNALIVSFSGFVSLEILSPAQSENSTWGIVQRFNHVDNMDVWRDSKERRKLLEDLRPLIIENGPNAIQEEEETLHESHGGVTEVFVTKVSSGKAEAYRDWIGKIHKAEAKFPGFRSVYVQSPGKDKEGSWITLLQFDNSANLDHWLTSEERREILKESDSLVNSLESHRVVSSFAGWFGQSTGLDIIPPVWKQTMMVLLVLFPIVMLELKFLFPLTAVLNPSLGTFIGNAISVSLVSWPLMPIAIKYLGWWLTPEPEQRFRANILGMASMAALYFLEIAVFWYLL